MLFPVGLGVGLGDGGRKAGATAPVFDPATLSLTGWWRASFATSPWTPTASAGTSGTNGNLSEATNPPAAGTAVNGLTPADFDGTNDMLVGAAPQTFVSQTAWSAIVLFKADSADVDGGAGLRVINPGLVTSDQGTWGVHYASDGVSIVHSDGVTSFEAVAAASTGSWHAAFATYDGDQLELQIDSGAPVTTTSVATGAFLAGNLRAGRNYNVGYFNGQILEIMLATSALGSSDLDSVRAYFNARYGLSL